MQKEMEVVVGELEEEVKDEERKVNKEGGIVVIRLTIINPTQLNTCFFDRMLKKDVFLRREVYTVTLTNMLKCCYLRIAFIILTSNLVVYPLRCTRARSSSG